MYQESRIPHHKFWTHAVVSVGSAQSLSGYRDRSRSACCTSGDGTLAAGGEGFFCDADLVFEMTV